MSKSRPVNGSFWLMLVISVICGLSAGVIGESLTGSYLAQDGGYFGELNLSNLNANSSGLVIRDAKKVVVNQDVKITEAISSIRPVIVSVFKEVPAAAADDNGLGEYYKLDEPLFVGLVITSDGWAIAATSSGVKADFKTKSYIAISGDKQVYKIDKFFDLKNSSGDLLIFHLASAVNLPVKKIVPRSELVLGQSLLVINGLNSVWPTTLTSLIKTPSVLSSDSLNANLEVAGREKVDFSNSFVFNLAGDFMAIISSDQKIVPAFSYNSSWQSLLKKEGATRPYLGVNYLDLSVVKTSAVNLTKGAWLYPSAKQAAVLVGSPAALAGLQAGDVITWINNQELSVNNDLADIVANYQPGNKIIVTYVRAGAEKEVEIILGTLK
jgi:hypothetical protein